MSQTWYCLTGLCPVTSTDPGLSPMELRLLTQQAICYAHFRTEQRRAAQDIANELLIRRGLIMRMGKDTTPELARLAHALSTCADIIARALDE